MTPRPDDTAARVPQRPPARHRGRAIAIGFVLGCLAGSSVAWAVSEDGSAPSATTQTATDSRPATATSANAAEHRAAERRAGCLTLGTADAIDRCLTQ